MMKARHGGYLVKRLKKAERPFSALVYVEKQKAVYDSNRDVDTSFAAKRIRTSKNVPYHIRYETDDLEAEINQMEKTGFMKINQPTPAPAISGGLQPCSAIPHGSASWSC